MMFILRLTNGDCVVTMAADERSARETARRLNRSEDDAAEVASVRRLDSFAVQFSPTEDGSLAVAHWYDATLDSILASEYPVLNEAYRRANAEPFLPTANPQEPALSQLKTAHNQNTEIIREGLRLERQRFSQAEVSTRSKTATGRR
jgi:hypothetical protein